MPPPNSRSARRHRPISPSQGFRWHFAERPGPSNNEVPGPNTMDQVTRAMSSLSLSRPERVSDRDFPNTATRLAMAHLRAHLVHNTDHLRDWLSKSSLVCQAMARDLREASSVVGEAAEELEAYWYRLETQHHDIKIARSLVRVAQVVEDGLQSATKDRRRAMNHFWKAKASVRQVRLASERLDCCEVPLQEDFENRSITSSVEENGGGSLSHGSCEENSDEDQDEVESISVQNDSVRGWSWGPSASVPPLRRFQLPPPRLNVISVNGFAFGALPRQQSASAASRQPCEGTASSQFGHCSSSVTRHNGAAQLEWHDSSSALQNSEAIYKPDCDPSEFQHRHSTAQPDSQHHDSAPKNYEGTALVERYESVSAPQNHESTSQPEQNQRRAVFQGHENHAHSSKFDCTSPLPPQHSHQHCRSTTHAELGNPTLALQEHEDTAESESHGHTPLVRRCDSSVQAEYYNHSLAPEHSFSQRNSYCNISAPQLQEGNAHSKFGSGTPVHEHHEGTTPLVSHGHSSGSQDIEVSVKPKRQYHASELQHAKGTAQPAKCDTASSENNAELGNNFAAVMPSLLDSAQPYCSSNNFPWQYHKNNANFEWHLPSSSTQEYGISALQQPQLNVFALKYMKDREQSGHLPREDTAHPYDHDSASASLQWGDTETQGIVPQLHQQQGKADFNNSASVPVQQEDTAHSECQGSVLRLQEQSDIDDNTSSHVQEENAAHFEYQCSVSQVQQQERTAQVELNDSASTPKQQEDTAHSECQGSVLRLQEQKTAQSDIDNTSSHVQEENAAHFEYQCSVSQVQQQERTAQVELNDSVSTPKQQEDTAHSECQGSVSQQQEYVEQSEGYDRALSLQQQERTAQSEFCDSDSSSRQQEDGEQSERYDRDLSLHQQERTAQSEFCDSDSSSRQQEDGEQSERYDRDLSLQQQERTAQSEFCDSDSSSQQQENGQSERYDRDLSPQQQERTAQSEFNNTALAPAQQEDTVNSECQDSVSQFQQHERAAQSELFDSVSSSRQPADIEQSERYDKVLSLQRREGSTHFECCDNILLPLSEPCRNPKQSGNALGNYADLAVCSKVPVTSNTVAPMHSWDSTHEGYSEMVATQDPSVDGTPEVYSNRKTAEKSLDTVRPASVCETDEAHLKRSVMEGLSNSVSPTSICETDETHSNRPVTEGPSGSVNTTSICETDEAHSNRSVTEGLSDSVSPTSICETDETHSNRPVTEGPSGSVNTTSICETDEAHPNRSVTEGPSDSVSPTSICETDETHSNRPVTEGPSGSVNTTSICETDEAHSNRSVTEGLSDSVSPTSICETDETHSNRPVTEGPSGSVNTTSICETDEAHPNRSVTEGPSDSVSPTSICETDETHSNRPVTEGPSGSVNTTSICETDEAHPNRSVTEGPSDSVSPTSICETDETHSNRPVTEGPSGSVNTTSICETDEAHPNRSVTEGPSDSVSPTSICETDETHWNQTEADEPSDYLIPTAFSKSSPREDSPEREEDSDSEDSSDSLRLKSASDRAVTEDSSTSLTQATSNEMTLEKSSNGATSGGRKTCSAEMSSYPLSEVGYNYCKRPENEDPSRDSDDDTSSWYSVKEYFQWSSSWPEFLTQSAAPGQSSPVNDQEETKVVPSLPDEDDLGEQRCMEASRGYCPLEFAWKPGSALDPRRGCVRFVLPGWLASAYQVSTQWKIQSQDAWFDLNLGLTPGGSGIPLFHLSFRICSQEIFIWLRNPRTGTYSPTTIWSSSLGEIQDFCVTLDKDADQIQVDMDGSTLTRSQLKKLGPLDPANSSTAEIWGYGVKLMSLNITEFS